MREEIGCDASGLSISLGRKLCQGDLKAATMSDFRFSTQLRVRWSECDAQDIVFYGSYMDFLDVGQGAYYRRLGIMMYDTQGRKAFDTATVKATLEYVSPARVDDVLDIAVRMSRIGTTSLTSEYRIRHSELGTEIMRAELIHVNYDSDLATKRPVPDGLRELIETFEATGEVQPLERFPDLAGFTRA